MNCDEGQQGMFGVGRRDSNVVTLPQLLDGGWGVVMADLVVVALLLTERKLTN